jgi:hypothetical protein
MRIAPAVSPARFSDGRPIGTALRLLVTPVGADFANGQCIQLFIRRHLPYGSTRGRWSLAPRWQHGMPGVEPADVEPADVSVLRERFPVLAEFLARKEAGNR